MRDPAVYVSNRIIVRVNAPKSGALTLTIRLLVSKVFLFSYYPDWDDTMHIAPGTIAQYTTDGAYPRTSYFIVTETFTFTIQFHTVWIVREDYGTWVVERKTMQAEDDMFAQARPLDRFEATAILSYALATAEEAKQRAIADLHKAESLLDRLRDVETIAWNAQITEDSY